MLVDKQERRHLIQSTQVSTKQEMHSECATVFPLCLSEMVCEPSLSLGAKLDVLPLCPHCPSTSPVLVYVAMCFNGLFTCLYPPFECESYDGRDHACLKLPDVPQM